jgi:hypothetical protein
MTFQLTYKVFKTFIIIIIIKTLFTHGILIRI